MRSIARRAAAGVVGYVVAYALMAVVTVPRLTHYLTAKARIGTAQETAHILTNYEAAGAPAWKAVGWLLLNAHALGFSMRVDGRTVAGGNLLHTGDLWLSFVPGVEGLVPVLACFLVGFAVVAMGWAESTPALGVGVQLTAGYVVALLGSLLLFGGQVGPARVTFVVWQLDWILYVLVVPVAAGSLGATAARSPVVDRSLRRVSERVG